MDRPKDQDSTNTDSSPLNMQELLKEVTDFLRVALNQNRPKGVATEALRLYHGAESPIHKTEQFQGAILSNWPSFVEYASHLGQDDEPLTREKLVTLLIHHTFNRKRRKDYADKKMEDAIARAAVPGKDGALMPFDPADPKSKGDFTKFLLEEIDQVLEGRSPRDRLVIQLRYFEDLDHKAIIEQVKQVMPDEPISPATITRIIAKFEDDLRARGEGG